MKAFPQPSKALVRSRYLCAALVAAIAVPAFAETPLAVTAVRYWSMADVTRIAVEISGAFTYEGGRVPNPDRAFYDLHGMRPQLRTRGMHTVTVNDSRVRQIRVAETQLLVTRVVLDLQTGPVEVTTSQLSLPDRLMIEVRSKGDAPQATSPLLSSTGLKKIPTQEPLESVPEKAEPIPQRAAPVRSFVPPRLAPYIRTERALPPAPRLNPRFDLRTDPTSTFAMARRNRLAPPPSATPPVAPREEPAGPAPAPEPRTAELAAKAIPVAASATVPENPSMTPQAAFATEPMAMPAARNSDGERSLTRVLGLKIRRVVLDPGHGGADHGTTGPAGLTEKDLVMDISRRLGALIEERMGSEVVYTRSGDQYVPLETRTQVANSKRADLFLSIHANSSPARSATGVETYYLSFTTSRTALDVAARENAASERSVHELRDLLQKIALKDKVDESREFAARVQNALSQVSPAPSVARNRGVKRAPFVVLIGAQMPSILAEIGFISNGKEEQLMKKPEHRQKIAEALYKGLSQYASTLSHFANVSQVQRKSAGME